ncbi:MAG TPA: cytochrome c [Anaerolineales bacterium]|nr:cytochrome c [Anaerolineales bacterium]
MRKIIFVIWASVLFLTACGGNGSSSSTQNQNATLAPVSAEYAGLTNPLGEDAADAGAEVFRINCEMCHGPQGNGDGPAGQSLEPKPGNLAELQTRAGEDYLFWRIHDGKPGTSMVAWKGILTDEQIWQTVSFIRTLK